MRLTVTWPGGTDVATLAEAIVVSPGPLEEIVVSPTQVGLQVQDTIPLGATAVDQFGNEISDVLFTWSALGPMGSIDETGVLAAGTQAGTFEGLVKVTGASGDQSSETSIDVTITPGPISKVVLDPTEVTLDIGATQTFTLRALDEFGNEISNALNSWSAPTGVGTIDANGGLTTGTKAGAFPGGILVDVVQGTARFSATADVSVQPDPLATIEVQPSLIVAAKGILQQLTAVGYDQYGNEILELVLLWEAVGGDVDQEGVFTPSRPGRHEVRASATFRGSAVAGSATVEIPMSTVVLDPTEVTLDIGATHTFTFRGWDEFGNEISNALTVWTAPTGVGTIDASGVLTTGTKAGAFPGGILVDVVQGTATFSATADVSVRPDPLGIIEVQPSVIVAEKWIPQQLTAVGYDQYGNEIPELAFLWEAVGGDVDQAGVFTSSRLGRHEVRASATFRDSAVTG